MLKTGLKILVVIQALLFQMACSDQQKLAENLSEYQQRVSTILDTSPLQPSNSTTLSYPSIRSLKKQIPEISMNLRDFYALQGCEVMSEIAQRNTSLGRTQLPSSRYLYEVSLLQGLVECKSQVAEQKVKDQLAVWINAKTSNLPLVWADLIQTSLEVKLTMSSNEGFITGDANDNISQVYQALSYLIDLENTPQANQALLEQHLKTLKQSPLLAKMWRSQLLLADQLSKLSDLLTKVTAHPINQATEQTQLWSCGDNKQKTKVVYLNNVFSLFFLEQIQPVASALNNYHYKLSPIINKLIENKNLSLDFKTIFEQQNNAFEAYQLVMKDHVVLWQSLLKQCGMSPTMN